MLQRIGLKLARLTIVGLGENDMVYDLRHPAVFSFLVCRPGFLKDGRRSPHELDVFLARVLGSEGIEIGRVAVEPADVFLIDRLDVVAHGAVVAAVVPDSGELVGQRQHLGDFDHRVSLIGQAQGLIVDVFVNVALLFEHVDDVLFAPPRPGVPAKHYVRLVAEEFHGLIEKITPVLGIAHFRAPERMQVVQRVHTVVCHAQGLELREVEVHLGRSLGTGGELKDHLDAVDRHLLPGRGDVFRRREQRHLSVRNGLADSGIDVSARGSGKQRAVHIRGATVHDISDDHVLAHGVFEESFGGDDPDFARPHIFL